MTSAFLRREGETKMKSIKYYGAALAAVLFTGVLVAGATEADEREKTEPEEFLSMNVSCSMLGLMGNFTGSGDLTGGGGAIGLGPVPAPADCRIAVQEIEAVLEGLPCETGAVQVSELSGSLLSVCQGARAELIDAMGDVGTAMVLQVGTTAPTVSGDMPAAP